MYTPFDLNEQVKGRAGSVIFALDFRLCSTTPCDWLAKLALLSQSTKAETHTNPDLPVTRVFPRFTACYMYLL